MEDEDLQRLYTWLDEIPLSRPKRNISRDFSDGGEPVVNPVAIVCSKAVSVLSVFLFLKLYIYIYIIFLFSNPSTLNMMHVTKHSDGGRSRQLFSPAPRRVAQLHPSKL